MYCGVLKALGPPGRSLSLEYSLQGGASIIRATIPDQPSLLEDYVIQDVVRSVSI